MIFIFGIPKTIREINGPQFRGPFEKWCLSLGIKLETSSAYNPRSNGSAESGVLSVKKFLKKCTDLKKIHSCIKPI